MRLPRLAPRSIEGQWIAILALSFGLLLAVLAALEVLDQEDVDEWAQNDLTVARLRRVLPAVELMSAGTAEAFVRASSSCHEGYTLTDAPPAGAPSAETAAIAARIARGLSLDPDRVHVVRARLVHGDFAYASCPPGAIDLPADGIVIGLGLRSGRWLNAEVHPHEWHLQRDMVRWTTRSIGAFLLVGAIAVFFLRRLARPIGDLTAAARRFGNGLTVCEVREAGPPELKRAIRSFNAMQLQVAEEVSRRARTLAVISHEVRTPLTALRIKAELVDDDAARGDLVRSIDAMERVTASALEFLRGECRSEVMRTIDLGALVESECSNVEEAGRRAAFAGESSLRWTCRPDALACAVRNLIDNAVKYAGGAEVSLRVERGIAAIAVADRGPGIPEEERALALAPFERLANARATGRSGFGLGLAIVQAIAEGHDGELVLEANTPTGLVATIRLPEPDES
jgi:signal transduction histidine kinase